MKVPAQVPRQNRPGPHRKNTGFRPLKTFKAGNVTSRKNKRIAAGLQCGAHRNKAVFVKVQARPGQPIWGPHRRHQKTGVTIMLFTVIKMQLVFFNRHHRLAKAHADPCRMQGF